jgi:hypothetical protein
MEKEINLHSLSLDFEKLHNHEAGSITLQKCVGGCLLSFKESNLLPTEEACLRNCFIKSHDFNSYMDD